MPRDVLVHMGKGMYQAEKMVRFAMLWRRPLVQTHWATGDLMNGLNFMDCDAGQVFLRGSRPLRVGCIANYFLPF